MNFDIENGKRIHCFHYDEFKNYAQRLFRENKDILNPINRDIMPPTEIIKKMPELGYLI